MNQKEWVGISYTLPREPSRVRVSIWRKLKKTGAVNIQQSMWVLPSNNENFNLLTEIKNEVSSNGGEAFIMTFSADIDGEKIIIDKFNAARDEEYGELLEQCEDYFEEIEKELARNNFTYAEIEENEEELNKLKQWYKKIAARDTFSSPLQGTSKAALAKCEDLLDDFCNKVYEFNDEA